MKKTIVCASLLFGLFASTTSCKKSDVSADPITDDVRAKVAALGFGTSSLVPHEDGYMVEGDIVLTHEFINSKPAYQKLRVGTEEQYHTTNLVKGLPRNVTVSISSRLPVSYVAALDEALARFNAEGLRITFSRVASGGQIDIVKAGGNFLASAGFPTSTGEPYNQVKVNSSYIGTNPNRSYLATILAHELGHCIGFRHTDYMNRQYSCGGSYSNEGTSSYGAIHIPGTPTAADPNSWMLACIGSGQSRPFNANDKTALGYLYR